MGYVLRVIDAEVRIGPHRLRVVEQGEGPPLLLIMGIGANAAMWEPLTDLLPGLRTIAFDAPGAGRSSTPVLPLSMPALAGIVVRLLDSLGLESVDVLGYSFGGALAQELTHRAPKRVRRLVLAATTCGLGGTPGTAAALRALASPRRFYSADELVRVAPSLYGGRVRREPEVLAHHAAARLSAPPSRQGYAWQLAAIVGWSSLPWLHRVTQPTLILAGDDDPATPVANARLMAGRMPNARLHVLAGAGHLLLIDSASEVAPLVLDFLEAP